MKENMLDQAWDIVEKRMFVSGSCVLIDSKGNLREIEGIIIGTTDQKAVVSLKELGSKLTMDIFNPEGHMSRHYVRVFDYADENYEKKLMSAAGAAYFSTWAEVTGRNVAGSKQDDLDLYLTTICFPLLTEASSTTYPMLGGFMRLGKLASYRNPQLAVMVTLDRPEPFHYQVRAYIVGDEKCVFTAFVTDELDEMQWGAVGQRILEQVEKLS